MFMSMNKMCDTTLVASSEVSTKQPKTGGQPGVMAGTKVMTPMGWRDVKMLEVGDRVLTFDGGMQPLTNISRSKLDINTLHSCRHNWPLTVPQNVLGNREAMSMMPNQEILVDGDTAEAICADPYTMIPASSLEGFRGIAKPVPTKCVELSMLQFAQDEMIYSKAGALFFCAQELQNNLGEILNSSSDVSSNRRDELLDTNLEKPVDRTHLVEGIKKTFRVAA